MPDPIPAAALSAAADAIKAQPAGSSAAHLARVALEAAAPLLRSAGGSAPADPGEYGPFDTERQALATRSAALIRAAFDDHPGYGASVPECLKVMTDACEAHGVDLGKLDLSFLQGVAWGETFYSVSLAGMITRAYQAGLAALPEGADTQWGVSFGDAASIPRGPVQRYYNEDDARRAKREVEALSRSRRGTVVSRQTWTGPWTAVPGEDGEHG